uniref:Cilia- and flagella-associated protein 410 n=1 Tax=Geotrypetes seraphini TaxID=260995 RepID=A0A6P8RFK2_GEOSA|nr:cilia- and flagella-associated protein 410 [Geotrypetes seraphini]
MKLNRKVVLSRAKAEELENVRKLNCWGCRLTDISICQELSNIEVITLSVNNISTLEPLSQCQSLCELYLRKNNIQNLAELFYLKELPRLKILWLAENPCCEQDPLKYRMTILRNLPNLRKLDNKTVTEEELSQAAMQGDEITGPPTLRCADNICPLQNGNTNTAELATELDSDLLNFSMEETNKIREQLGMKPLPKDKFSSFSSHKVDGSKKKRSNILSAILLLIKDLDKEALEIVHRTTATRLHILQKEVLQEKK